MEGHSRADVLSVCVYHLDGISILIPLPCQVQSADQRDSAGSAWSGVRLTPRNSARSRSTLEIEYFRFQLYRGLYISDMSVSVSLVKLLPRPPSAVGFCLCI